MVQHRGDAQKCARAPITERSPYIELFPPKPIPSGESHRHRGKTVELNTVLCNVWLIVSPDLAGFEMALAMPSPRTLKSHLPVHLLPTSFWEQNCKVRTIGGWVWNSLLSISKIWNSLLSISMFTVEVHSIMLSQPIAIHIGLNF